MGAATTARATAERRQRDARERHEPRDWRFCSSTRMCAPSLPLACHAQSSTRQVSCALALSAVTTATAALARAGRATTARASKMLHRRTMGQQTTGRRVKARGEPRTCSLPSSSPPTRTGISTTACPRKTSTRERKSGGAAVPAAAAAAISPAGGGGGETRTQGERGRERKKERKKERKEGRRGRQRESKKTNPLQQPHLPIAQRSLEHWRESARAVQAQLDFRGRYHQQCLVYPFLLLVVAAVAAAGLALADVVASTIPTDQTLLLSARRARGTMPPLAKPIGPPPPFALPPLHSLPLSVSLPPSPPLLPLRH